MKKVTLGLLTCGLVLTTGIVAHAEGSATTKADIKFTQGGTEEVEIPTPTPNPDPSTKRNPDPDPMPGDLTEPGNKGPLKFVDLPKINFGEVELAPFTQNYFAQFQTRKYTKEDKTKADGVYPTLVAVQDLRGGAKGWSVSVSHNGRFTKTGVNGGGTIKAGLSLKGGNVRTNTFNEPEATTFKPESAIKTDEYTNISYADTTTEVAIFKADPAKKQGYGKWSIGFGGIDEKTSGQGLDGNGTTGEVNNKKKGLNPGVRLTVPTQIIDTDNGGAYETTLVWTLSQVK
ncbi:WxL domain-containing protein [Vagococcus silagei]|nr:WxL domain-containing protein [Vagococcus silagei]